MPSVELPTGTATPSHVTPTGKKSGNIGPGYNQKETSSSIVPVTGERSLKNLLTIGAPGQRLLKDWAHAVQWLMRLSPFMIPGNVRDAAAKLARDILDDKIGGAGGAERAAKFVADPRNLPLGVFMSQRVDRLILAVEVLKTRPALVEAYQKLYDDSNERAEAGFRTVADDKSRVERDKEEAADLHRQLQSEEAYRATVRSSCPQHPDANLRKELETKLSASEARSMEIVGKLHSVEQNLTVHIQTLNRDREALEPLEAARAESKSRLRNVQEERSISAMEATDAFLPPPLR